MAEKFTGRVVADMDDGSVTVTMPKKAIIKKTDEKTHLSVPRGQGYDGYRYEVDPDRVTEIDDENISVAVTDTGEYELEIKKGDDVRALKTQEIADLFANASDEDFTAKWIRCEVPSEACATYANSTRVRMPDSSEYADKFTYIGNGFKKEEKDGKVIFSLPDTWELSVGNKDSEPQKIDPATLKEVISSGTYRAREKKWERLDIPKEARLYVNEKNSCFVMPKGEFEGKSYYLPNGMVRDSETEGYLTLVLPKDVKLSVVGGGEEKKEISVEEFKAAVTGRKKEDYPEKKPAKKGAAPADNKAAEKKFDDEQSL